MNGKIPRFEKPRGNLVMCETNCLRLKIPCFRNGYCSFLLLQTIAKKRESYVYHLYGQERATIMGRAITFEIEINGRCKEYKK